MFDNATTRRLAVMNLALRGIEVDFGPEHADTFRRDRRLNFELRTSNFELGNGPPFKDSDWFRKDDDVRFSSLSASNGERAGVRCRNDLPPKGNANFAHGSMSSNQPGEGDIRRALIEADWEISSDEMRTTNRVFPTSTFETHPSNFASLPSQLFYSTQIPVCLWFVEKNGNASAKHAAFKMAQTQNNAAMAKAHSNFQLT